MPTPKKPVYDDHQKKSVTEAFGILRKAFPGLSDKQLVEGPMAHQVMGDLPPWSTLESHRLTNVMTALRGAAVICWFKDQDDKIQVVMGARPAADGKFLYNASGGGFANLDFTPVSTYHPASKEGEQPAQTAARELREEICDETGKAVLDLDPKRFHLISAGVDNRGLAKGGHPTDCYCYSVELKAEEVAAITAHCARIDQDPAYLEACKKASGGETAFVKVMSLQEAAQIPLTQYAHPHESTVITGLAAKYLKAKPPKGNDNKPK